MLHQHTTIYNPIPTSLFFLTCAINENLKSKFELMTLLPMTMHFTTPRILLYEPHT